MLIIDTYLPQRVWYPPPRPRDFCVHRAVWTPLDISAGPRPYPHLRYAASTSFNFSRSDDALYFTDGDFGSYGRSARGSISFTTDPNVAIDQVQVDVVATYESRDMFRGVDVCTLWNRPGSEHGVGIFVSSGYFTWIIKLTLHLQLEDTEWLVGWWQS